MSSLTERREIDEALGALVEHFRDDGFSVRGRQEHLFTGWVAEPLRSSEDRHGRWADELWPLLRPGHPIETFLSHIATINAYRESADGAGHCVLNAFEALLAPVLLLDERAEVIALNAAFAVGDGQGGSVFVDTVSVFRGWERRITEQFRLPRPEPPPGKAPRVLQGAASPLGN